MIMIDKLLDISYIFIIGIVLVLLFVLWITREKKN